MSPSRILMLLAVVVLPCAGCATHELAPIGTRPSYRYRLGPNDDR